MTPPEAPTTAAGRALLPAHADMAVYCGMPDARLLDAILAIEREAASEALGLLRDARHKDIHDFPHQKRKCATCKWEAKARAYLAAHAAGSPSGEVGA